MTEAPSPSIAVILIGRNEGPRLDQALTSLHEVTGPVIYVDSGSTDQSVALAKSHGADVVELDMSMPFTAARARNAGLERLNGLGLDSESYVQFMDGDCALQDGWLPAARGFLDTHPEVAAVCGRRRERNPGGSVYNWLTDHEWDTPVGEARACGGDVLMRLEALRQVGGYNPELIAGEEPDLCLRMRQNGWRIWRIDVEMTWHDAAMTKFRQWWQRCRRAGHAFAEGAAMHGHLPERYNVVETRRALIWGAGLPLAIVLGCLFTPLAVFLAGLWGLKLLKLRLAGMAWRRAFFLTLGNLPEAQGALGYFMSRVIKRERHLIEYK